MVNTQTSFWRRRRVDERPTETLPERGPAATPTADLDLHDALWTALRRLPPRQRATVVLRYYEDLSEAETAAVLGVSRRHREVHHLPRARQAARRRLPARRPAHRPPRLEPRMSPLDDELRAALHARADSPHPAADPWPASSAAPARCAAVVPPPPSPARALAVVAVVGGAVPLLPERDAPGARRLAGPAGSSAPATPTDASPAPTTPPPTAPAAGAAPTSSTG